MPIPNARWIACLLLVLSALLCAPLGVLQAEDDPVATLPDIALWSDQAHLEKELAFALEAVTAAEGKAFKRKPTIRTTDAKTMNFTIAEIISYISRDETLFPGDFIGAGTLPSGCGLELDRWLSPGDIVELQCDELGVLRNRVVRSTN